MSKKKTEGKIALALFRKMIEGEGLHIEPKELKRKIRRVAKDIGVSRLDLIKFLEKEAGRFIKRTFAKMKR